MKLIIAIVSTDDSGSLTDELARNKISVTKLSSTGGFLRSGNVTLMIGCEADQVDNILDIIRKKCVSRKELVASPPIIGVSTTMNWPVEINVGGATVFILEIDRFEKI